MLQHHAPSPRSAAAAPNATHLPARCAQLGALADAQHAIRLCCGPLQPLVGANCLLPLHRARQAPLAEVACMVEQRWRSK